jgi:putative acetyltransferase
MTAFQIRPVEPEDWADVAEIFEQPGARAGTLQMPYRSRAFHRERLAAPRPNSIHICAVAEGKVIGTSALTRLEGRRSHVGTIGMGIHDAWTGKGAGTALMTAMLDTADRWWGLRRVELTVYADNARAIGLYKRFGFVREGLHRDFALRDGALVDALAMARLR